MWASNIIKVFESKWAIVIILLKQYKIDTETPRRKLHKSKGKIGYGCYDEYRAHSLLHVIA